MQHEEPGRGDPLGPLDWLKLVPFEAATSSAGLRWAGLDAARYRAPPTSELSPPALTHHRLVLFVRPPEELDLRYEGVKRHRPPPAGAISLVPAGTPSRWRSSGGRDLLQVYLEPGLVARPLGHAPCTPPQPARLGRLPTPGQEPPP